MLQTATNNAEDPYHCQSRHLLTLNELFNARRYPVTVFITF